MLILLYCMFFYLKIEYYLLFLQNIFIEMLIFCVEAV